MQSSASGGCVTSTTAETKLWLQSLLPLLFDCWAESRPVAFAG